MFFAGYALGLATIMLILNFIDKTSSLARWISVAVLIILATLNLLEGG